MLQLCCKEMLQACYLIPLQPAEYAAIILLVAKRLSKEIIRRSHISTHTTRFAKMQLDDDRVLILPSFLDLRGKRAFQVHWPFFKHALLCQFAY